MKNHFWKLILPITFQQFMLALVSASDVLMLGGLNQDSLSAVSLTGQIAFVFNLFMAAMTIGTSMFAAQYWGSADKESVSELMAFVLRTILLAAFILCACATFAPRALMYIFTGDDRLVELGARYLRVVGTSYIFSGVSQIYLCIMKNSGRAGRSMLISSVTAALNILLNAVLIYGLCGMPAMHIAGAALAAFVFQAPVIVVYFLLNLDEVVKLQAVYRHYKKYRWVRNLTKE